LPSAVKAALLAAVLPSKFAGVEAFELKTIQRPLLLSDGWLLLTSTLMAQPGTGVGVGVGVGDGLGVGVGLGVGQAVVALSALLVFVI
jgi:hypothetical protein